MFFHLLWPAMSLILALSAAIKKKMPRSRFERGKVEVKVGRVESMAGLRVSLLGVVRLSCKREDRHDLYRHSIREAISQPCGV